MIAFCIAPSIALTTHTIFNTILISLQSSQINQLEMVQHRAARFMKHDYARTSSITNMQTDLKWDTLQQRRINTRTTLLFRIIHNLVDIEPDPPLINARSNRGHTQRLSPIQAHTAIVQNSFFTATVVFWNKLPQVVVDQTSLDAFKPAHCILKSDVFILLSFLTVDLLFLITVSPDDDEEEEKLYCYK